MNSSGTLKAMEMTSQLTQTILSAPLQMMDHAAKLAAVNTQMKVATEQEAQLQEAVAMMTGVGTKVNTSA